IERLLNYLKEMSEMLVYISESINRTERNSICVRVQELEKKVKEHSLKIITGLDNNFLTEISREDIVAIAKTAERISEKIMEACDTVDYFLEDFQGSKLMNQLCVPIRDSISAIFICFKHINKSASRLSAKDSSNKISHYNKFAEKSYQLIKAKVLTENTNQVYQIKLIEWLDRLNDITEQCVEINYIFDLILVKK
ncbi:MAG: hypothetical protein ACK452_05290, partial [Bacteroidota bacterium]